MSHLLHIDSSATPGDGSVSRRVARSFRASFTGPVIHRDLGLAPVPHLTAESITARSTEPAQHTPEQAKAQALQDELIEEFLGASAYLFTIPLYNLTMPSVFKAWLDQIMIFGRTLAIGATPPTAGRPATVITARGGSFGPGTPNHGMDHLVPSLEAILNRMLGLDLRIILPELTHAPLVPAMADLIPLHERALATAHEQAAQEGELLAKRFAA
ncbi:FMN-dependent NADH-azoreductase [Streptomyces antimycoticus]|uniref:FMN-dependent NADH-azoreductase n=1 Tax=Streptomyces antimycoticus TaxID=68175 RepID=UPI0036989D3F